MFVCLFVLWLQVRQVSQEVLFTHNSNISLDATLSHLLVEWGQWIDHDVVHTPQSPSTTAFRTGADCTRTCSQDTPCFPIQVLPTGNSAWQKKQNKTFLITLCICDVLYCLN